MYERLLLEFYLPGLVKAEPLKLIVYLAFPL
jgi:hypothetical protein